MITGRRRSSILHTFHKVTTMHVFLLVFLLSTFVKLESLSSSLSYRLSYEYMTHYFVVLIQLQYSNRKLELRLVVRVTATFSVFRVLLLVYFSTFVDIPNVKSPHEFIKPTLFTLRSYRQGININSASAYLIYSNPSG